MLVGIGMILLEIILPWRLRWVVSVHPMKGSDTFDKSKYSLQIIHVNVFFQKRSTNTITLFMSFFLKSAKFFQTYNTMEKIFELLPILSSLKNWDSWCEIILSFIFWGNFHKSTKMYYVLQIISFSKETNNVFNQKQIFLLPAFCWAHIA